MTAPNVHIRSVPDDPRRTTIAVDGREVIGVVAARWEAEVRGWPTVTLEIDIPALDVRGSLVGVEVSGAGADGQCALSILAKIKAATVGLEVASTGERYIGLFDSATADLTDDEAALWERIEP